MRQPEPSRLAGLAGWTNATLACKGNRGYRSPLASLIVGESDGAGLSYRLICLLSRWGQKGEELSIHPACPEILVRTLQSITWRRWSGGLPDSQLSGESDNSF